jgi:predicted nucleotidyltransferase
LPAVDVMDERLEAELRELVQRLRTDLNQALVTVCLFGSQVDGAAPERDIDLLVIWDGAPDRRWGRGDRIRAAASAVSPRLEAWLSPIVLTPEEARDFKPYYLGILDRHRLLFDRERFFATVLDRLRRRLAEMGARRLTDPDGFVYWDLAPNWQPGDEVIL